MRLHFHSWLYYNKRPWLERQCAKCDVWQHNHDDGDGWKWGKF